MNVLCAIHLREICVLSCSVLSSALKYHTMYSVWAQDNAQQKAPAKKIMKATLPPGLDK